MRLRLRRGHIDNRVWLVGAVGAVLGVAVLVLALVVRSSNDGDGAIERPSDGTTVAIAAESAPPSGQVTVPADAVSLGVGGAGTSGCGLFGGTPVTRPPRGTTGPGRALVTAGALNLRAGPGTDCPVVGSMGFGMTVELDQELVRRDGHLWRRVTGPAGTGYALADAFASFPKEQPTAVPVLMYHHISDERDDRFHVTPKQLEAQLSWLKSEGYVSITPADLSKAAFKGLPLPAKPIMLTIDDGNPSTMTFQRLLDEYGFRGVYFLPNYAKLSEDEIVELATSGEVCGHTVSHPHLAELSEEEQRAQIADNKAWLEEIVGRPVTCFGYPFGSFNEVTDDVVEEAGYQIAFNAWGGVAVLGELDRWHVLRREIYREFTLDDFVAVVESGRS